MNFAKRAILNITRKKGKAITLFVILMVIANLVLAGFAIQSATEQAGVLARQKLGGQLVLRYDAQRAMENVRANRGRQGGLGGRADFRIQSEPITEEMAQMLTNHTNILDYNYIVNAQGIAKSFEPVNIEEGEIEQNQQIQSMFSSMGRGITMPDLTITGVASTELMDTFNNGQATLIEGRHITHKDGMGRVAIIEENLAYANDLNIGDTILIGEVQGEDSIEFTIVGIFKAGSEAIDSGAFRMREVLASLPYNRVFTDYQSSNILKYGLMEDGTITIGIDSAVYFADDPLNIPKIKKDAEAMNIDWEKFTLDDNEFAYKQMMGPIENVASFSTTVVHLVAIAGAIILGLILMLSIKERIYETGVLLSMGEAKWKIIAQYVSEVVVIALLAFMLSMFTGQFIAQGVGDVLMEREMQLIYNQEESDNQLEAGRGMQASQFTRLFENRFQTIQNNNVEIIDAIEVEITITQILKMIIAGLLIVIIGTIVPATTVMRFNPKTILTKAI